MDIIMISYHDVECPDGFKVSSRSGKMFGLSCWALLRIWESVQICSREWRVERRASGGRHHEEGLTLVFLRSPVLLSCGLTSFFKLCRNFMKISGSLSPFNKWPLLAGTRTWLEAHSGRGSSFGGEAVAIWWRTSPHKKSTQKHGRKASFFTAQAELPKA